jgi:phosphate transport system substrate-binding protein
MIHRLFRRSAVPVLAALLLLGVTPAAPVRAQEDAPKPAPPTAADTARFQKFGRPLPAPELLQPTLDPALPAYTPHAPRDLSGRLTGAASDVLANLAQRWITAFKAYYPNVTIEVPPPYSGKVGAKELVSGKVDFALVSRELVPSDVTDFKAKFGWPPLSVPIMGGTYRDFGFLDAVGFFVHKDNPLTRLTFTQLDALLSTTRYRGGAPVRTWGQLGLTGAWADRPIHVWAVKPWNGFEEFVRERVLSPDDRRGEWRPDLNFVETVFPIAPHVAADPDAIGYAGLAYLNDGVKLIALAKDDHSPFHPPSYEEVARARYLLSRLVYCNVNRAPDHPLAPALDEFIHFILSREGQQVVLNQAVYIPLRATQAAHSLQLVGP